MGQTTRESSPGIDALEGNTRNKQKIKNEEITVIITNPPYSAGQKNENDDNKNEMYWDGIDGEIKNTYVKKSKFKTNRILYNSYIRSIKNSLSQLAAKGGGVLTIVNPNSYIDSKSMDGMRACLAEDCKSIHLFNLRGDIRKSITGASDNKTEGANIFGAGCSQGIAIGIFIASGERENGCKISYYDIADQGESLSTHQKIEILDKITNLDKINF